MSGPTAANARVAELEVTNLALADMVQASRDAYAAANARAETAELANLDYQRMLNEEAREWRAKCAAAEQAIGELNNAWHIETMRKLAAESEAASLRAEVDGLRHNWQQAVADGLTLRAEVERLRRETARADLRAQMHREGRSDLESSLATATELLGWAWPWIANLALVAKIREFLANALAVPTRFERRVAQAAELPVSVMASSAPTRTDGTCACGSAPVNADEMCATCESNPELRPTRIECKYVGRCNSSRCEACSQSEPPAILRAQ